MSRRDLLERICREHSLLSVYLFGSRADEGLAMLAGAEAAAEGSDLDVGVVFENADDPDAELDPWALARLQVAMEDLFEPLRVDLVPLQKVDAIFQFRAIDGHRIAETNSTRNSYFELSVMRRGAELLPIQRARERRRFGFSTT